MFKKIENFLFWDKKNLHYKDIVILPSFSFDKQELFKVEGFFYYEQRLLINLLLLQDPNTHIYYISSIPLDESILNYYQELSGSIFKERLHCFSCLDTSKTMCLSEKLLKKPRLISRIKNSLRQDSNPVLLVNISTFLEEEIGRLLEIPIIGIDHRTSYYGTKSGSNLIFRECEIPYPDSTKLCNEENEYFEELFQLIKRNPSISFFVIKLNNSFSGKGNAILNIQHLKSSRRKSIGKSNEEITIHQIKKEIKLSRFEVESNWEYFKKRMNDMGIIAQIFIDNIDSPSCQGCINNDKVHIISTHDQILSGKDHQIYSGCSFPSESKHQEIIIEYTQRIGENLLKKGVRGCFGVDYLVSKDDSKVYAIEINIRMTGTTHPMLALKYLVEGDFQNGFYVTKEGKKKYYVSSDNIIDENYKKLLPQDLIEICKESKLLFQKNEQIGTIFHMLGSISEYGKFGMTCIGDSIDQAKEIYQKTLEFIDQYLISDMDKVK